MMMASGEQRRLFRDVSDERLAGGAVRCQTRCQTKMKALFLRCWECVLKFKTRHSGISERVSLDGVMTAPPVA